MKVIFILLLSLFFFTVTSPVKALGEGEICDPKNSQCNSPLVCIKTKGTGDYGETTSVFACQKGTVENIIGKIEPPEQIGKLGFGADGLSNFLSRIIGLIFTAATIIFVFMVIITAVQWILSGGDKEAVAGARKRLTWAIIGIVFLALAFIIIKVIGQITGFEFFAGQNQ